MSLKDYYEEYWTQETPPPSNDPLTTKRLAMLLDLIQASANKERRLRVLDSGSGEGLLVAELSHRGHECLGMDIAESALARAFAQFPDGHFTQGSVEERPWPVHQGYFDIVVGFEVIEHLLRPREFILGAWEALLPGGYLAITTPYHGILKNLLIVTLAFDKHFAGEGDHVRFFSVNSLRSLLVDVGFEEPKVMKFGRCWGLWAGMFFWARKPI